MENSQKKFKKFYQKFNMENLNIISVIMGTILILFILRYGVKRVVKKEREESQRTLKCLMLLRMYAKCSLKNDLTEFDKEVINRLLRFGFICITPEKEIKLTFQSILFFKEIRSLDFGKYGTFNHFISSESPQKENLKLFFEIQSIYFSFKNTPIEKMLAESE